MSGKLPVSFPRDVGTTPIFYNYLKGSRPLDAGRVFDDGKLLFGHEVTIFSMGKNKILTSFHSTF